MKRIDSVFLRYYYCRTTLWIIWSIWEPIVPKSLRTSRCTGRAIAWRRRIGRASVIQQPVPEPPASTQSSPACSPITKFANVSRSRIGKVVLVGLVFQLLFPNSLINELLGNNLSIVFLLGTQDQVLISRISLWVSKILTVLCTKASICWIMDMEAQQLGRLISTILRIDAAKSRSPCCVALIVL